VEVLLTLEWVLTGTAIAVAIAALLKARRLARRLERLTESYWELRYELGQVRSRVNRLDPEPPVPGKDVPEVAPGGGTTAFVPLSSLRR
jgi:hypothetical protein